MTRLDALRVSIGAILVVSAAGSVRADVITLQAMRDNTIFQESSDLSNGAGQYLFSGTTKDGSSRRALMRFDIASNIPAGATINSASLQLYLSRAEKPGSFNIRLHRLTSNWGEGTSDAPDEEGKGEQAASGDATWAHTFYPDSFWGATGGDYVGAASATTAIGESMGFYAWSSGGMAADIQSWLDAGANYGWILIGHESVVETARRFNTREHNTVLQRPQLTIDFTPLSPVGACCLPADSCAVLTSADCATAGGVYQGDLTSCSPSPCVVPTGACCFDDGTCLVTTQSACTTEAGTYQGDGTNCQPGLCPLVLTAFVDSLPIPPLAVPTSGTQGGVATYDIEMREVARTVHRDLPPTTVWGYDGIYPGPTILASTGNPVTVNWINDLRDSTGALRTTHFLPVDLCVHGATEQAKTVVHLHGGHVPAAVDGHPDSTFLPGQQVGYVYPNNQHAATLWYHDHALGITRLNVMMGLAGAYVIRDSVESALDLPAAPYDIPLIIQDRSFNSAGRLLYPASMSEHFFGDKILVNGKVWPFLGVNRGKYRFRVLNGSNSRVYALSLSNGHPFSVIGTDGGLLPAPVPVTSLTIHSGERYEIVIDFAPFTAGTEIVLQNSAPAPFPGTPGVGVIPNVMKFVVQASGGFTSPLPGALRPVPAIHESLTVMTRTLIMDKQADPCAGSKWLINGLHWNDITEFPVRGTTEIWRFVNDSGVSHPMHMHLVFFQILDRTPISVVGDSVVVTGPAVPPPPEQTGWMDTADVPPNQMLRVIATFEDYLGRYPYHCHILEHEDHEMMRQFEVVDPVVGVPHMLQEGTLTLLQHAPNPLGPSTTIRYTIPQAQHVTLRVLDVNGRMVAVLVDAPREAGTHHVTWRPRGGDGRLVPSGIYFIELQSSDQRKVRKATVLR